MSMTLVSTVTIVSSGITLIDFQSIPSTFTDLVIVGSVRDSRSAVFENMNIVFNENVSTIYSARRLYGTGSGVASDSFSSQTSLPGTWITSANATSNTFNNFQCYIPNYAGSTNKSISMDSVTENNATSAQQGLTAGLFASTSPISIIRFGIGGNQFAIGSTVSLYGITKGSGGATVS